MRPPGGCGEPRALPTPAEALRTGDGTGTCGPERLWQREQHQLWVLPSPVLPAVPPLVTMGTLRCDLAPRLTTAPLGRRATECQIPETGLRKTCGLATLGDGTCWLWGRGMVVGPFPGASEGSARSPSRVGASIAFLWLLPAPPPDENGPQQWMERPQAVVTDARKLVDGVCWCTGQGAERSDSDINCGVSVRAPAGASVSLSVTRCLESALWH